jgi:hypothetical protein
VRTTYLARSSEMTMYDSDHPHPRTTEPEISDHELLRPKGLLTKVLLLVTWSAPQTHQANLPKDKEVHL